MLHGPVLQEYEHKVLRACLAAVARRQGGAGIVVSYADIGREMAKGTVPEIVCDGDGRCARIYVPEGI